MSTPTSMPPSYSSLPTVKIGGLWLPKGLQEALGPCWVESGVNLPGAFSLMFRDPYRLLTKQFPELLRIGARVAVSGDADGQSKTLIAGLVTGIEAECQGGNWTTVLRGLDYSFKMLRHRRAVSYQEQTASEIVRKLAAQDQVYEDVIQPTKDVYEVITQPNISDWEFVQYLAASNNMEAEFTDEGLLRFCAPTSAGGGLPGSSAGIPRELELRDIFLCRASVTASDQVNEVTSRGWDVDQNKLLLGTFTDFPELEKSLGIKIGTNPVEVVSAFGSSPVTRTETRTPYGTDSEINDAAKSLAADIASAFAELEVQVNGRVDLAPGLVVALKDVGTPFDGTYTVTATRHEWSSNNYYTTWVWVSGRQVRTLYGLVSGGRPPAPRIDGVVNAIVSDIEDPKQQGRVKLHFPWFSDTYTTDWVRTVQFGGKGGGGVISPEMNDEVLVAFDRGMMDYPYVIGGLYSNSENEPSDHEVKDLQTRGRLNRRSLVSRSGQRLELLDAATMTGVRLRSGDKALAVFLDQTKTTITISSNGSIDISGNGKVSVSSKEEIALDAPNVSINGSAGVSISSSASVSIRGGAGVSIGGTADVNIGSAADVNIGAADVNITGVGDVNVVGVHVGIDGIAAVTGDLTLDGAQVMVVP